MAEVERTYYIGGELKSEVFALNGKKNGIYQEYHKNGNIYIITYYIY
jgi:antitoxin component YwqK of YwqJK toxin-antitoxin module